MEQASSVTYYTKNCLCFTVSLFRTVHKMLIMFKKQLIKFYAILFVTCSLTTILCELKHVRILSVVI